MTRKQTYQLPRSWTTTTRYHTVVQPPSTGPRILRVDKLGLFITSSTRHPTTVIQNRTVKQRLHWDWEMKLNVITTFTYKRAAVQLLFLIWTFCIVYYMVTAQRFGSQLCFHPQVQTYLVGPFERVAFSSCVSDITVQGIHHIGLHVRTGTETGSATCVLIT